MVSAIDYKNKKELANIDLYDLSPTKIPPRHLQEENRFTKETRDVGIMADFNSKLIVSQDWFYSQLFRDMIRSFYRNKGIDVPEEILKRFRRHDESGQFCIVDDPNEDKSKVNEQEQENP